ncbi:MAG: STAS domain-containing protein [Acidobacteriaceae bacterium]
MTHAQVWKNSPFTIERTTGKDPGTVIFRLCGPFTARDMYGAVTPDELSSMLTFPSTPEQERPLVNILDLTEVPYIDSSALGMIVKHYVGCKNKGIRWIAAGASPRVLELLKLTKMDGVLPSCASVEEAELS